jgi:hypothetical protein
MRRRFCRRQSGQAVVLVAASAIVLAGILMLALDGGSMYLDRRQLQSAADAGALAGAEFLQGVPPSYPAIHRQALNVLLLNLPGTTMPAACSPSCPDSSNFGGPPPALQGSLGNGYTVQLTAQSSYRYQVQIWHTHSVAVAPIHGFQTTVPVWVTATARNATLPYAVVVLQDQIAQYSNLQINGTPGGLNLSNAAGVPGGRGGVFSNASINPGTGMITFNPGCPAAGDLWAVSESAADQARVNTEVSGSGCSPEPKAGAHISFPTYPEPPTPSFVASNGASVLTGQTTYLCPGQYGNQINIQSGAVGILLAGAYAVQAGGVKVDGILRTWQPGDFPVNTPITSAYCPVGKQITQSDIDDPGVIVEITPANASGSTVCNKHQFQASGTSSITLVPSKKYYNINLYIETMNNWQTTCSSTPYGTNVVSITGGGFYNIQGTIYGPADNMKINGGAAGSGVGQVVAWTLTLGGNGALNETFDPAYLPYLKGLIQ